MGYAPNYYWQSSMTREKSKPWIRQWQIPSSRPGKTYIVSLSRSGEWSCACKGWTTHTPRKACKHINQAKETGDQYLLWSESATTQASKPTVVKPIAQKTRAITFDD